MQTPYHQACKRSKVSQACLRCRHKKRKCNGIHPCSGCVKSHSKCIYKVQEVSYNELYNGDASARNEMENINCSLARLKSNYPLESGTLQQIMEEFRSKADILVNHLRAGLDMKKLQDFDGKKSLETLLLDTGTIQLNLFSEYEGATTSKPSFNEYFGMYSPVSMVSVQGGAWLIKKLIQLSLDTDMKITIYLFLKYLDANGTSSEAEKEANLLTPFDGYVKICGLRAEEASLDQSLRSAFSIACELPCQSFIDNAVNNPIQTFKSLVALLKEQQEKLCGTSFGKSDLNDYLESDFLISSLCFEFFERTIFVDMLDIDVLLNLVDFLALRHRNDFNLQMSKIVASICRLALDLGLNRWEYNIGRDEETANVRRKLWWRCYWWDKWYALTTGKAFILTDELSLCLFPKELAKLGVECSMSVTVMLRNYAHEALDVDNALNFGYILLAKLIEQLQRNIVYNKELTDFKTFSGRNRFGVDRIIDVLMKESNELLEVLTLLGETLENFVKQNMDNAKIFEFYMHMHSVKSTCFKNIGYQLLKFQRVLPRNNVERLDKALSDSRTRNLKVAEKTMFYLLQRNKVGTFFKYSISVLEIFFSLTELFVERPPTDALYIISLICCMAQKYVEIAETQLSAYEVPSHKNLGRCSQMLLILTRVCCLAYMRHQSLNKEELKSRLQLVSGNCVAAYEKAMDSNNVAFHAMCSSKRISFLREAILKFVKMDLNDFLETAGETAENSTKFTNGYNLLPTGNEGVSDNFPLDFPFESLDELFEMESVEKF